MRTRNPKTVSRFFSSCEIANQPLQGFESGDERKMTGRSVVEEYLAQALADRWLPSRRFARGGNWRSGGAHGREIWTLPSISLIGKKDRLDETMTPHC